MEKLKLFIQLMSKGSEVADVEKWKSHQITAAQVVAVVGILVGIAKAFHVEVPFSLEEQGYIGMALYAVVNWVLTAITSKRAGFEPKVPDQGSSDSGQKRDDTTYIG